MRRIRSHMTYANVMATLAVFLVLGGGAYAAFHLPKNSVRSKNIVNRQVKKADLANSSVTSSKFSSSAVAPSARIANHAYMTSAGANSIPDSFGAGGNPLATLDLPTAGDYVINAKLDANNTSATDSSGDECALGTETLPTALDQTNFEVAGTSGDDSDEVVALQTVTQFDSAGQVTLNCTDGGIGTLEAGSIRLTALRVAGLTVH
jgi:hypothetical protein